MKQYASREVYQAKWISTLISPKRCLHTYIIDRNNSSVMIIDLDSHNSYVVCVNFMHKWQDQQYKVDSERQIFWRNFPLQFYLLSEFLPAICWDEIAEKMIFLFLFEMWPRAWTLALSLISQHITYLTTTTSMLIRLNSSFW